MHGYNGGQNTQSYMVYLFKVAIIFNVN